VCDQYRGHLRHQPAVTLPGAGLPR
jgi:hypothetical protein